MHANVCIRLLCATLSQFATSSPNPLSPQCPCTPKSRQHINLTQVADLNEVAILVPADGFATACGGPSLGGGTGGAQGIRWPSSVRRVPPPRDLRQLPEAALCWPLAAHPRFIKSPFIPLFLSFYLILESSSDYSTSPTAPETGGVEYRVYCADFSGNSSYVWGSYTVSPSCHPATSPLTQPTFAID